MAAREGHVPLETCLPPTPPCLGEGVDHISSRLRLSCGFSCDAGAAALWSRAFVTRHSWTVAFGDGRDFGGGGAANKPRTAEIKVARSTLVYVFLFIFYFLKFEFNSCLFPPYGLCFFFFSYPRRRRAALFCVSFFFPPFFFF